MNRQFDIIIVGDSKKGNEVLKRLASVAKFTKIAFVSREFKSSTTRDFLNVEYIKDEVALIDYKNRLFGCHLSNHERLYSTHIVIASGVSYAPLTLGNRVVPCVLNSVEEVTKLAKNQQAIVLGKQDKDIKLALEVSKKYKYVYLCIDSIEPDVSENTRKKLFKADNILVLPNTFITKVTSTKGELKTVELDSYSTITCAAIFVKTAATPETSFISDKIIRKDEEGYLETDKNLESTIVPKCFAVGNCTRKNSNKMLISMVNTILNDFMEATNA